MSIFSCFLFFYGGAGGSFFHKRALGEKVTWMHLIVFGQFEDGMRKNEYPPNPTPPTPKIMFGVLQFKAR